MSLRRERRIAAEEVDVFRAPDELGFEKRAAKLEAVTMNRWRGVAFTRSTAVHVSHDATPGQAATRRHTYPGLDCAGWFKHPAVAAQDPP